MIMDIGDFGIVFFVCASELLDLGRRRVPRTGDCIQTSEDIDETWSPSFDLPKSSSTSIMSDMLRLAFTSQVSPKVINRRDFSEEEDI